jgi:hypothetical protein
MHGRSVKAPRRFRLPRWSGLAAPLLALIAGCAGAPGITTQGGPEDVVAIAGAAGSRLLLREPRGEGRIGQVDVPSTGAPPPTTTGFVRPDQAAFAPLGLALAEPEPGRFELLAIDRAKAGAAIRRFAVPGGATGAAGAVVYQGAEVDRANDLVGFVRDGQLEVWFTRFKFGGFLPWGHGDWVGLVRVRDGQATPFATGLAGANGIAWVATRQRLLVSDFWERRLRWYDPASGAFDGYATAELPIHPDNLTLDPVRGEVLIAGPKHFSAVVANLLVPSLASASMVLAAPIDSLSESARPATAWEGGWSTGSVSVAVPVGDKRLALGQMTTPGLLIVERQP